MAAKKAKKKGKRTRTTLRSSKGTKLYAVRNADGTFHDIQSYKRSHAADLRRTSKEEAAAKAKKKTKTKAKTKVKAKAKAKAKKSKKVAARKK